MTKKKYPNEIKAFEKEMVECWHQAMGNKNIPYGDSIMQAGLCAERLCKSLYIRKYSKLPGRLKFVDIIKTLQRDKIFDNQMVSYMNHFRHDANQRRHTTTIFKENYLNITRLKMVAILDWYVDYTNLKIRNLKSSQYSKKLKLSAANTYLNLQNKGILSDDDFLDKVAPDEFYGVREPESTDRIISNPIYAGLLLDESGSMCNEKNKVITGQNAALKAIRGSLVCKSGNLRLMQQVFHHEMRILNPLTHLDSRGSDKVITLNEKNYNPIYGYGMTYLYDSLYRMVMTLTRESDYLQATKGRKPEISIGILTDGADNKSQDYQASDVKKLVDNLREEGMLRSAVVIGWKSDSFTEKQLIELKDSIGFDSYIGFDTGDQRAIRRAFDFWSQMIIKHKVKKYEHG